MGELAWARGSLGICRYLDGLIRQTEDGLNPDNNWLRAAIIKISFCVSGDLRQRAAELCRANPAIDEEEIAAVAELAGFGFEEFCVLQVIIRSLFGLAQGCVPSDRV